MFNRAQTYAGPCDVHWSTSDISYSLTLYRHFLEQQPSSGCPTNLRKLAAAQNQTFTVRVFFPTLQPLKMRSRKFRRTRRLDKTTTWKIGLNPTNSQDWTGGLFQLSSLHAVARWQKELNALQKNTILEDKGSYSHGYEEPHLDQCRNWYTKYFLHR